MKLNINAIMTGEELLQFFVEKLKSNNIETAWKDGALPSGVQILITNKAGQEVDISPDKLKIVFNNN
jgi:hypothetical protein